MSDKNPTIWEVKLDEIPQEFWTNAILMRLAAALGLVSPLDYEANPEPFQIDPDWLLEEVEERLRNWTPLGTEELLLQESLVYINDERYVVYRNRETGGMIVPPEVEAVVHEGGVEIIRQSMEEKPFVAFRVYTQDESDDDD